MFSEEKINNSLVYGLAISNKLCLFFKAYYTHKQMHYDNIRTCAMLKTQRENPQETRGAVFWYIHTINTPASMHLTFWYAQETRAYGPVTKSQVQKKDLDA